MATYENFFKWVPTDMVFEYEGEQYQKVNYFQAVKLGTMSYRVFCKNDKVLREYNSDTTEPVKVW